MLLDGLHIPLTTPFYPDGRVYFRKLEHNAERYSRTPASGLTILTTTGEASLVSDEEAREVFRIAVQASATEKVLLADVSHDSVRGTLELADHVASLGYDGIVLRSPSFLSGGSEQNGARRLFFDSIADRSPLPIVVQDHASLPLEVIGEMSARPIFLGMVLGCTGVDRLVSIQNAVSPLLREVVVTPVFTAVTRRMLAKQQPPSAGNYIAAGSLSGGATALATAPPLPAIKTRTKKVGFQLLCGQTTLFLEHLASGAAGAVLPFATAAPQAVYEVLAAWKDGNPGLAAEKQGRLLAGASAIEQRLGIPGLKAASDLNGYYGGKPRLPLIPLSGIERSEVEDLMAGMRN